MTGRHAAAAPPAARAVAALGALLLPVSCAGCGRPDTTLCRPCRGALGGSARPVGDAVGVPVLAVVPYAGAARRILLAWKDDGRHDLDRVVGAAVARSLRAALPTPSGPAARPGELLLVVPVPSSAAASRRRGGDVLAGVCRQAVRRLRAEGRPVALARPLRQRHRVADQAGLGAGARRRNLAGALTATRGETDLRGRAVVLVDDVVTTGATLAEAVRAMRAAGATVLAAAVVAATPLRSGQPAETARGGGPGPSDYRSAMEGRAPGDGRCCAP